MEVPRSGYATPFRMPVGDSHHSGLLRSPFHEGRALEEEIQALCRKGAVEPGPPTSGFYSRMFVVPKVSGGWRPIIDLSTLNMSMDRIPIRMETAREGTTGWSP